VTERTRVEFLTPCAMFLSSHCSSRVYHSNKLAEGMLGGRGRFGKLLLKDTEPISPVRIGC
jgi:hypothetical protein